MDNSHLTYKHTPVLPSQAELLTVYPEGLSIVKRIIRDTKQEIDRVNSENMPHFEAALDRIYFHGGEDWQIEVWVMLAKFWYLDQHIEPLQKKLTQNERILRLHEIRVHTKDSPDEVNELTIRNAKLVEMSEVVSEKPNHAGFVRCPFHNEKTASCKIHKHRYHCFGCGADGDVIDWLTKTQGLSFLEAVRQLNRRR